MANRHLAEAKRELERVKQKMQRTDWNRGYFRALYGMFLSRKSNGDSYAFFPKLDLADKATMHTYRREFLGHVGNKLHGDFDRGYFSAWADCMRILSRLRIIEHPPNANGSTGNNDELTTVKANRNQPTMEVFLQSSD